MKKSSLAACPACARHVRVSETHCPFCREALPSSLREQPAPLPPATRLSRAALYAFGVGTLSVTTAACGGAVTTSGQTDSGPGDANSAGEDVTSNGSDGSEDVTSTFGVDAAYGAFPPPDANVAVPYGLPAMEPDAGSADADADAHVIHYPAPPPYGGPPPFGG